MRKPDSCKECPFYEMGSTFVPDEVRDGAKVFVMGQNPGAEEEAQGRPFVGKTGKVLESYLKLAGLSREDVSLGNAIRCRVKGSNELPPITQTATRDAILHCRRTLGQRHRGSTLLVALGDYAAWDTTGESVGEWRGYVRPYGGAEVDEPWVPDGTILPVLVMVHPARLFRDPSLTLATKADWAKVARILSGRWPRRPPAYLDGTPNPWPVTFSFDTEYTRDSNRLIRYSMAWGTEDNQSCVVESSHHQWNPVISPNTRVISQYAPADMRHLDSLTSMGLGDGLSASFWNRFVIEDSVWKHAVLWSDQSHDLNYLGSIYSSFNRWKHLGGSNPRLYSALDAIGLLEVDQALQRELDADPWSKRVWESIDRPALGEFVRAQYRGLRTDPLRVQQVIGQLSEVAQDASRRAVSLTGWPINLGSNPQVAHQLYTVERIKVPR